MVNDALASEEAFPRAHVRVTEDLDYAKAEADEETYVVITTQHKSDYQALERVLRQGPAYVGLVASPKRSALLFERLHEDGFELELLKRVSAPAGLDVGARTPQEIALSIFSEILTRYRRGPRNRPTARRGEGRRSWRRGARGDSGAHATVKDAIDALYKEVVLEHFRRPRNRSPLDAPDGSSLVVNPICGDQVRVEVKLCDRRVSSASARTRGCSIAVASGSVMTEIVAGMDRAAIARLAAEVERVVRGDDSGDQLDKRLRAFHRVAQLPSRQRCALLPWEALEEALDKAS